MKKQLDDFRAFILRGNLIDLAVAVVIGLAFTAVITALVADLITPLISIPGKVDFSAIKFTINGSTFLLGSFLNALISFVIIAAVLFFLIIQPTNALLARYKPTPEPPAETKECPYCLSSVPVKATRCAFCTSQLDAAAEQPPDTGIKSSSATKGSANS